MITLSKFGIELVQIQPDDLEMIRSWRNADEVRRVFEYKTIITPNDQKKWFAQLDTSRNFYFVFSHKGLPLGVVSIKEINWDARGGEAGIFLGDTIYVKSPVPITAVIILMQFAFNVLNLNYLIAKIHQENNIAIEFNKALGYTRMKGEEQSIFQRYRVNENQFNNKKNRLLKSMDRLISSSVKINFNDEDILSLPVDVQSKLVSAKGNN